MDNKQFVTKLSKRVVLDYKETSSLLRSVCGSIVDVLRDGDSVALPGFGTFATRKEDERIESDPETGKRILLPPSIKIDFRQSVAITKRLEP